jgi:hypothetical protein
MSINEVMEVGKAVVSVAWAIGVYTGIPAVIIIYRSDIRAFLARLRTANVTGVGGITLDPSAAVQSQQKLGAVGNSSGKLGLDGTSTEASGKQLTASISSSDKLALLPGVSRTNLMETVEKNLYAQLPSVDEHSRLDFLVHNLAVSRLETIFERIYRVIFGSQILALRTLNSAIRPVSIEDAQKFFADFKEKYPEAYDNYGFDGWFGFLIKESLITIENNLIVITEGGRDFLMFLTHRRLPESKPY